MTKTICAVCKKIFPFVVIYQSTFVAKDVNPQIYTPRRVPDCVHFRMVRCKNCGLIYSNPVFPPEKIIEFYKKSTNPGYHDLINSARVYGSLVKKILKNLPSRQRLLDIGCGDGFFLLEAKKLGFKELYGVEPSRDAVSHISELLNKKYIVNDIFRKGQFKKDFFDIVCSFHVLDHVFDPNQFLKECFTILKPEGYLVAVVHDACALTHRILGERSPIFDIQHIYLFDKETAKKIFNNNGFMVEDVFNTTNRYSLGYWLKMAPLPFLRKLTGNERWPIFKLNIPLRVGNMAIIARKK